MHQGWRLLSSLVFAPAVTPTAAGPVGPFRVYHLLRAAENGVLRQGKDGGRSARLAGLEPVQLQRFTNCVLNLHYENAGSKHHKDKISLKCTPGWLLTINLPWVPPLQIFPGFV
jgi:hypothetical protein